MRWRPVLASLIVIGHIGVLLLLSACGARAALVLLVAGALGLGLGAMAVDGDLALTERGAAPRSARSHGQSPGCVAAFVLVGISTCIYVGAALARRGHPEALDVLAYLAAGAAFRLAWGLLRWLLQRPTGKVP